MGKCPSQSHICPVPYCFQRKYFCQKAIEKKRGLEMRVLENGSSAAFQSARNLSTGLLLTTSFLGLLTSQAIAQGSPLETVVVTGTSIRGAAPTGSNLLTADRAVIVDTGAKSVQELLTNVPQINVGFGSAGQAAEGGGGNVSAPNIHS